MKVAGPLGTLVHLVVESEPGTDVADGTAPVEPSANGRLVLDRLTAADASTKPAEVTRARSAWAKRYLTTSDEARELADAWQARREALASHLASQPWATSSARESDQRWAVALVRLTVHRTSALLVGHSGAGTAAETSLTLHPVTGQPWMTGSGIKGAARAMRAERELDDQLDPATEDGDNHARGPTSDELYGRGGADGAIGRVRVLDAIAHGDVKVGSVVMTPHSPAYYENARENPPGRWENPVPVPLLAVIAGTFTTLVVGHDPEEVKAVADDIAEAADWLGLGARTAAGFGYVDAAVELLTSPTEPREEG